MICILRRGKPLFFFVDKATVDFDIVKRNCYISNKTMRVAELAAKDKLSQEDVAKSCKIYPTPMYITLSLRQANNRS